MRTIYRALRSAVLTAAAVLGALCILVFSLSLVFGVQALNVISGSMEPGIPTGSLLLTTPVAASNISVGDVVTAQRPSGGGLITHRVVSVTEVPGSGGAYELRMQGDANASADPQPYVVTKAGAYLAHVPVLGTVATVLQSRVGLFAAIAVASLLVLLYMFPAAPPRGAQAGGSESQDSPGVGPVQSGVEVGTEAGSS